MTVNSKTPTLNDWLVGATTQLAQTGIPSARLDCELLVSFALSKPRTWIHAHLNHKLSASKTNKLHHLLSRRLKHEPLAYITNNKEFFGRDFYVNDHVLVPRPETEDLIELVLNNTASISKSVLDLGTGSGIIGITLALQRPKWRLTLSDISPDSIKVAKKNARKHDVFDKIQFLVTDMLPSTKNFDIICANLPYVPLSFKSNKDISFEPPISLFSGDDGLDHYRDLFSALQRSSHQPKLLVIEAIVISHPKLIKIAQKHNYQLKKSTQLSLLFELF